jgi:AraC family transcriptional regulator of arabinose operon
MNGHDSLHKRMDLYILQIMAAKESPWDVVLLSAFDQPAVTYTWDLAWAPLRSIAPHTHDFYQLDFFYGGYGKVAVGKQTFTVTPGDLYIANPGDEHEFHAAPSSPLQGITFKFEFRKGTPDVRMPNHICNLAVLPGEQQRELHDLLRRSSAEFNHTRHGHQQASGMLLGLFFVLLTRYLDERRKLATDETTTTISKAVQAYIKRCYHLPLTLADLARLAGLHPRYFCQRFSKETGLSPMAALTNERIGAAKKLLESTHLPVSRIGAQVGYPDVYHFSKRFKALTGKSPKQFRAHAQRE